MSKASQKFFKALIDYTFSQQALPVSHSVSEEKGKEQKTQETVSLTSSERSQLSDRDISVLRMSQDYLTVLTIQEQSREPISGICFGSYTKSGMMSNGKLSAVATLDRPGLESDSLWLESPTAMSSNSSREPGMNKLEYQLRQLGGIKRGEVSRPEFLESGSGVPLGWTDPQDKRSISEFLQEMV